MLPFFKKKTVNKFSLSMISTYSGPKHWGLKEEWLAVFLDMPINFLQENYLGEICGIKAYEHIYQGDALNMDRRVFHKKIKLLFGRKAKYQIFGDSKLIY
jgi:hypothetical protein